MRGRVRAVSFGEKTSMKRSASLLLSGLLGLATFAVPAAAAPVSPLAVSTPAQVSAPVQTVQADSDNDPQWRRRGGREWRGDRGAREWRGDRGRQWRGDRGDKLRYARRYGGPRYGYNRPYYRSNRPYRPYYGGYGGYRPYGGSGVYLQIGPPAPYYYAPRRAYRTQGSAHVRWCHSRYRSYRAYDNTYVPKRGYRAQCVSPYSYRY